MNERSMYASAMGEASFARLSPAVQGLHRLSGKHVLQGWVETDAPAGWLAGLLALCLGSPRAASAGPLRFELDARPEIETWIRGFPTRTMRSQLRLKPGLIEEKLGASRLLFRLTDLADGGLRMELLHLRFFGLPCPRVLTPKIIAEETGDGDRFNFRVSATVPGIGRVASYRGYLQLRPEAQRS